MTCPDISVVVPTCNRAALLRGCLDALLAQGLERSRYEVIVVDDASADETQAVLQSFAGAGTVRTVRLAHNAGQAAAKNAGAAIAAGGLLLFLDDDMRVAPGCLQAHLDAHDGQARVVFGPIETTQAAHAGGAEAMLAHSLRAKFERLARHPVALWPIDASVMPNSSLPRALFLETGGFDAERFPRRREDEEFGVRLWKRGIAFTFATAAAATHHWLKDGRLAEHEWIEGGAALVRLYAKHPDLAGSQRVFGRLLRRPPWQRHLAFTVARHRWLTSACIAGWRLHGAAQQASLARALFALRGAIEEAGGAGAFATTFAPNAAPRP